MCKCNRDHLPDKYPLSGERRSVPHLRGAPRTDRIGHTACDLNNTFHFSASTPHPSTVPELGDSDRISSLLQNLDKEASSAFHPCIIKKLQGGEGAWSKRSSQVKYFAKVLSDSAVTSLKLIYLHFS